MRDWFNLKALFIALVALLETPALAAANPVETSWRLLDYIAVDYAGAVSGGRVKSAAEYAEMQEFSASVHDRLAALPSSPRKADLIRSEQRLRQAIDQKADAAEVARLARALGSDLLKAYPVALGPKKAPDLARGLALYHENCAACHGDTGGADTAMARQLDPRPIAFADRSRAAQRSPFALYQVIDQGLEGTAMQSFSSLPASDKWALAFAASGFAYDEQLAAKGKRIWSAEPKLRQLVPDLNGLAGVSEQALASKMGSDRAAAVLAYLRGHPDVLSEQQPATLSLAKQRLAESVTAYEAGDREKAKSLALSAYLDGFEPVEAMLATKNSELLATVERDMGAFRSAIGAGRPAAEVRQQADQIEALFSDVEAALSTDGQSATSTFVGAFAILLREGLEALLIVIGMLAFLRKADRPEMERPVHLGWLGALVAGGLTWWAATHFISVSGASRELTEGFGSLFAAIVLLFVGIWMHGKAQAGQWQRYIREKMDRALSGRSAWFLFGLAFIAVYREVFETILFYAAMAAQGQVKALVAGGLTGAFMLAAIGIAMLKFSQRLPIGKFFAYSSALVAVLAVVLAGKGVAALQEAGMLGIRSLPGIPRIDILGLFPTVQTVGVQIATLLVLAAGFAWNRRPEDAVAA